MHIIILQHIHIYQGLNSRGGDLKVQKDQNFGPKSPKKTNLRRQRRRKFLKHEKCEEFEEFQGKLKFIQEKI